MGCDGKKGYATEKEAKTAARQLRKAAVDWFRIHHYWCDEHRVFHIGNRKIHLRRPEDRSSR